MPILSLISNMHTTIDTFGLVTISDYSLGFQPWL